VNILVCGGAGYIGSRLCMDLLRAGHKVTALDSFLYGQDHALLACCDNNNFEVHKADCRDGTAIKSFLAAADVIYWLAALFSKTDDKGVVATNLDAVENLCGDLGDQLVIFLNTNAGYDRANHWPIEEDRSLMVGKTPYSRTKIEAEKLLMKTDRAVSFRLATVYGLAPRMRWDTLVNYMVLKAVKDKSLDLYEASAKRDVLHVSDAVRAMIMPLSEPNMKGQIYNVGEKWLTKVDICHMIKSFLPDFAWQYVEGTDPEERDYEVSYQKIKKLGFQPIFSVGESIPNLVKAAMMK